MTLKMSLTQSLQLSFGIYGTELLMWVAQLRLSKSFFAAADQPQNFMSCRGSLPQGGFTAPEGPAWMAICTMVWLWSGGYRPFLTCCHIEHVLFTQLRESNKSKAARFFVF